MKNLFIGVDPGKEGAIAVIDGLIKPGSDNAAVLEVRMIPMIVGEKKKGKKAPRPEYDIEQIAAWFKGYRGTCSGVTVERSQPLSMLPNKTAGADTFKPGSIAQFNRGVQRGFAWLLTALDIPFQLVPPRTWQKTMLQGEEDSDTKKRAINAALRLFPGVDLRRTPRCTTPHDGIAEALLLAEYGRLSMNELIREAFYRTVRDWEEDTK